MQGRLTYAEECVLCGRAQAGDDEARDRLVTEHLGLARMLARRAARSARADVADLAQEGVLGIFHAIKKFDPANHPGVRFGSYAGRWIRQRIGRALADDRLIHIPEWVHKAAQSARGPDRLTATQREYRDAAMRILSAEWASICDEDVGAPILGDDGAAELGELLAGLSMIERHVLARMYGLDGGEPAATKRIAAEIGCSAKAVQRIAQVAVERLREGLSRRHDRRRRPCAYPKKCNPNRRKG